MNLELIREYYNNDIIRVIQYDIVDEFIRVDYVEMTSPDANIDEMEIQGDVIYIVDFQSCLMDRRKDQINSILNGDN